MKTLNDWNKLLYKNALSVRVFVFFFPQSPTKAVYNARHWNHPEPEELLPTPPSRSQAPPVSITPSTGHSTEHLNYKHRRSPL